MPCMSQSVYLVGRYYLSVQNPCRAFPSQATASYANGNLSPTVSEQAMIYPCNPCKIRVVLQQRQYLRLPIRHGDGVFKVGA